MKKQTLRALTLLAALSLAAGCRNTDPRVTVLQDGSRTTGVTAVKPNLDTPPIIKGGENIDGKPITMIDPGFLPNEERLKNRDVDRAFFANETVRFQYDQATVIAKEAGKIDQVAAQFRTKGADFDLLIEGHADERGTEEYNRALGERRALALRELLMQSGLDGQRIFTRSFGKDQPVSANHDDSAWSQNRRGEFVLVLPKKIITTLNHQ